MKKSIFILLSIILLLILSSCSSGNTTTTDTTTQTTTTVNTTVATTTATTTVKEKWLKIISVETNVWNIIVSWESSYKITNEILEVNGFILNKFSLIGFEEIKTPSDEGVLVTPKFLIPDTEFEMYIGIYGTNLKSEKMKVKTKKLIIENNTLDDTMMNITIDLSYDKMPFSIENKLDTPIKMIWNECQFIDNKKEPHNVFGYGIKYIDANKPKPDKMITPKSIYKDIIVPADAIYFDKKWYTVDFLNPEMANKKKASVFFSFIIDEKKVYKTIEITYYAID